MAAPPSARSTSLLPIPFPLPLLLSLSLLLFLSSPAQAQQRFSFNVQTPSSGSNGVWGAISQFLRPLNVPLAYVSGYNASAADNAWGVAPAGSFLLWGTQPDISLSPDQGYTWVYTSGTTAGNVHLDSRDVDPLFPGVYNIAPGNAGCNHRTAFNRFYLMGNVNTNPALNRTYNAASGTAQNLWFSWASNDGQIWNQVMSNASAYQMAQQRTYVGGSQTQNHICVVDQKQVVYSVGAADLYFSSNLGVTWVQSVVVNYFPARWGLAGAIYSPTTTSDTIVVLGGTSAASGALLNDIWSSTNGGLNWGVVAAAAPWPARQEPIVAIHSNGVMVLYGGDCGGGWCGVYADAWVSVNGGATWYLLSQSAGWNMTNTAAAFDAAGYLWLVGGQNATSSTSEYNWVSALQKSSLSFATSQITAWSSAFSGGTTFSVTAAQLASLSQGAPSLGGNVSAIVPSVPIVSQFSCANTTLPYATGSAFNLSYVNNGNGWDSVDVQVTQIPSPIVYGQPRSGSSSTVDPYTGYWYGTAWLVAPAGSWVLWGTQEDVAISTNAGLSWTWTSGGTGTGLGWAQQDYAAANNPAQDLSAGNAECSHRASFTRFYVIGNNGLNNASNPFEVWAANDAQVWTQVADPATAQAMATIPYTSYVQCLVGVNDVVYYLAGSGAWQSSTLGRSFTLLPSASYFTPRQAFAAAIYAPQTSYEVMMVVAGQNPTGAGAYLQDVWSSSNYGQSWTMQTANAGFSPRLGANLAVSANGIAVLHGGAAYVSASAAWVWYSDVWASANGGAQWVMLASSTPAARAYAAASFDPSGYFYINSGQGPAWTWNADVWKSGYSFNNIGLWGPTLAPQLSLSAALTCTIGTLPTTFDLQTTSGTVPWGAVDQFIRVTNQPIPYVTGYGSDGKNQWGVAPAGSWLLFGTQPDVSVSTNNGASWTITSGTNSGNPFLDARSLSIFPTGTGNAGCGHRTSFNRFYLLGSCNNYQCNSGPYFNWATQDGTIWYQAMDNTTAYAMQPRRNMTMAMCVVDQQERVYSVGGADAWQSSNYGVTFTKLTPTTPYFTPRTNFAGGIYSPTPASDVIVVIGGVGASDVWQSSTYGSSWQVVTTAVPWSPRGNMNFGIAQNGVFVLMGGDLNAGLSAEYNDVWASLTYGASWVLLSSGGSSTTSAPGLSMSAVAFDAQGYAYLVAGQAFQSVWTGQQYKSTLSFTNISSWAGKLTGNGASAFTIPAAFTPTTGANSIGGPRSGTTRTSITTPVSNFSCASITSLPSYNTSIPFDLKVLNTGIGWNNVANLVATTVAPILYEVAWSNTSYGAYPGTAWQLAPAGSLLVWGGNTDVALSTDQGSTWTGIAGLNGNPGLPTTSMVDFDSSGQAQALGLWNTQCAHRNAYNRFYVLGNNVLSTSATLTPYAGWASDDGLTWTEVMDNATSYAMAADTTEKGQFVSDGVCVVGLNDVVYYVSGNRTWASTSLGVTFTPVTPTSSPYLDTATRGVRFNMAVVIYATAPMQDRIVVLGGQTSTAGWIADVWASTNYGQSYTLITPSPGWSARQDAMVAVSQSGVIALVGGMAWSNAVANWVWFADSWASLDGGVMWYQLSSGTSLGPLAYGGISVDANGYIITSGGMSSGWSWTNPVAKSTYSLNNIQQWLPALAATAVTPAGYCPVTPAQYVRSSSSPSAAARVSSTAGATSAALSTSTATAVPVTSAVASPSTAAAGAVTSAAASTSTAAVNSATSARAGATSASTAGGATPPGGVSNSSSGLSGGAVAGIVIGCIVGMFLLLLVCFVGQRTGKTKQATSYATQPEPSQQSEMEPSSANSEFEQSQVEMQGVAGEHQQTTA